MKFCGKSQPRSTLPECRTCLPAPSRAPCLESGWKIDFIIRKSREFSRVEFDRRVPVKLLGVPVVVATPEDVVIAKLEWAKRSGSERQIDDAGGILRSKGVDLDRGYVERWVAALGLAPQWAAALLRAK